MHSFTQHLYLFMLVNLAALLLLPGPLLSLVLQLAQMLHLRLE